MKMYDETNIQDLAIDRSESLHLVTGVPVMVVQYGPGGDAFFDVVLAPQNAKVGDAFNSGEIVHIEGGE